MRYTCDAGKAHGNAVVLNRKEYRKRRFRLVKKSQTSDPEDEAECSGGVDKCSFIRGLRLIIQLAYKNTSDHEFIR